MSHTHVNSYDPDAPRPDPGTTWLWEPPNPAAYEVVRVLGVDWNGEEWWVTTSGTTGIHKNDLGRFWEAVEPDTPKARIAANQRRAATIWARKEP